MREVREGGREGGEGGREGVREVRGREGGKREFSHPQINDSNLLSPSINAAVYELCLRCVNPTCTYMYVCVYVYYIHDIE